MTIGERDKRALILLAAVALVFTAYHFMTREETPPVVGQVDSIPLAEKTLARYKQLAGAVPGKEQALAAVTAELVEREKGLIQAETAAQAQAQLLQIVRKIAKEQENPIDLRNTEIGQVRPFGEDYGEVAVAVNFDVAVEQLINLLSRLTAQKEIIGTTDLRIGAANPKQKTMPVRITISALVKKELIPDKKGPAF